MRVLFASTGGVTKRSGRRLRSTHELNKTLRSDLAPTLERGDYQRMVSPLTLPTPLARPPFNLHLLQLHPVAAASAHQYPIQRDTLNTAVVAFARYPPRRLRRGAGRRAPLVPPSALACAVYVSLPSLSAAAPVLVGCRSPRGTRTCEARGRGDGQGPSKPACELAVSDLPSLVLLVLP